MRIRPSATHVLAIVGLAAFTVWITWRAKGLESRLARDDEAATLRNGPAPDFSLSSIDGSTISLGDYRGKKKLVLTYWASWCGPCRLEMLSLRSFYQHVHKADSNFEILAISIDDDAGAAERFAAQSKLIFPVLLDSTQKVATAYGVTAIPTTFIVDESGTIIYGHTGFETSMEFILAQELGIKNYTPAMGEPNANRGH
jgi:peroxiredoxin